jgi:secondary thiamine-phosphate synthase enzyme
MVVTETIELETRGNADTVDITGEVAARVRASGLRSGIVTVFCPGSTHAVTTIEYESGALADLKRLFDEIVPPDRDYAHNRRWGDGNGHSHVRAALLRPSLTIPFVDGELLLGTWQQITYIDFDNRPRSRRIVVQIVGE